MKTENWKLDCEEEWKANRLKLATAEEYRQFSHSQKPSAVGPIPAGLTPAEAAHMLAFEPVGQTNYRRRPDATHYWFVLHDKPRTGTSQHYPVVIGSVSVW